MIFVFFFILGSIWGSFCNVCIFRLPEDKGVVIDRSFCPKCKKIIKWYDNIPLISFLFLKRKCRNCDYIINIQYFIVELLTAISFCLIYYIYGLSVTTLLFIFLSIFFLIIFFYWSKTFYHTKWINFSFNVYWFCKIFLP